MRILHDLLLFLGCVNARFDALFVTQIAAWSGKRDPKHMSILRFGNVILGKGCLWLHWSVKQIPQQ